MRIAVYSSPAEFLEDKRRQAQDLGVDGQAVLAIGFDSSPRPGESRLDIQRKQIIAGLDMADLVRAKRMSGPTS